MTLYERVQKLERQGRFREMRDLLTPTGYPMPDMPDAEGYFWRGVTLGRLGKAEGLQGAQSLARHLLSEARDLFDEPVRKAECDSRIAMCGWREKRYSEAEFHIRKALSQIDDSHIEQQSVFNTNLSIILCDQEKLVEARHACEDAIIFSGQCDAYVQGLAFMETGRVWRYLGEMESAFSYCNAALAEFEEAENPYMLCLAYNNLADLCNIKRRFDESRQCVSDAFKLASELNDAGLLNLICGTSIELVSALRDGGEK